ncbi:exodeoxyribonuclease III [Plesiocystis pacifica SIR-1]|uniref:Exodeoxyribonuclease III n=1 Tax=Plesiocystis pacifica SIR-1 TaxID=391625 RepID=A6GE76_9BACT|nr:exodeoxyribonuclease III [Plesiocystis pacifica]EDM75794.1 exodeoxyribonuclease III [Plesiocystis pacifica SIR-1]
MAPPKQRKTKTKTSSDALTVLSWNINGLRAAAKKGFGAWLAECGGDIVGVQEIRAFKEQLDDATAEPEGWHSHFRSAVRPGYSGVGLYSRAPADKVEVELGEARFDDEGRVQLARFGRLFVANVYFPNGNGRDRDNSRVPYKLDFYRAVFELVERKRRGGYRVLVMGDFNTAHEAIDLARPKQNVKTSGFLPEEREELDRWIRAGWIDTFRSLEPGPGHYSWWSQRGTARERNVGWRIDYVLASPNVEPFLREAFIWPEVPGSDHCPVGVRLDRAVLARG